MGMIMVSSGALTGSSAVAMKLLIECGMISGAGSPDTAIAELELSVLPAPQATCNRAEVTVGIVNARRSRIVSGECSNPVSFRNRTNRLLGSDFSAPSTSVGLSRVSRSDVEAALAKAGAAAKELNLFETFNV